MSQASPRKRFVLVVDDEKRIVKLVSDFLKAEGYEPLPAYDGKSALEVFYQNASKIALIILDVMMPELSGWQVLEEIRGNSDVCVIMLTAKAEDADQLFGFASGADDYVTKPFSPSVLMARVKNLLKRSESEKSDFGEWQLDAGARSLTVEGKEKQLTPKEYDLLAYFIANKGIALSREKLLNAVWNYDFYGDVRTVDTHVKQLRAKLKGDCIQTVRGFGYRFCAEAR
ncbi:MAG: response regulator transcription factor [Clostridiales bacterium]|jgi:DNA-binding response OmpR family regulator|nr:response regulator transcription factor [Clostridiales bacterium]